MNNLLLNIRRAIYITLGSIDQLLRLPLPPVTVFCYHSLSGGEWRHSISLTDFQTQINFLLSKYDPISLTYLHSFLQGKKSITKPAFVLTFDDGYRDILRAQAYLANMKIKPCVFVLSNSRDKNLAEIGNSLPMLTNYELRALLRAGWEVGSHSATHANLALLNKKSNEQEVINSKLELEKALGKPVNYFALPRGKHNLYTDQAIKQAGYYLCLTMDDSLINSLTNPLSVPRVAIDQTHSPAEFRYLGSPSVIKLRQLLKRFNLSELYE